MTQRSCFEDDEPMPVVDDRTGWARLSDDGLYRWALGRPLLPPAHAIGTILFIMLNPSTADAKDDDPTIRRCRGFGMREAMCELVVCNLSAWRAAKPADLWANYDQWKPRQLENRENIQAEMTRALTIVCAWGAHGGRPEFAGIKGAIVDIARTTSKKLYCLGTTKDGEPRHPLFIDAKQPFEEWKP